MLNHQHPFLLPFSASLKGGRFAVFHSKIKAIIGLRQSESNCRGRADLFVITYVQLAQCLRGKPLGRQTVFEKTDVGGVVDVPI